MKMTLRIISLFAFAFAAFSAQGQDAMKKAELGGYCPVAYIALGKAVEGKAEFAVDHEGKTYYFVNGDAAAAFKSDPDKFLPAYDGWCAYGMSFGKKFESDPTVFSVVDGRLFLNKSPEVGELFAKGTKEHIAKADAQWEVVTHASM